MGSGSMPSTHVRGNSSTMNWTGACLSFRNLFIEQRYSGESPLWFHMENGTVQTILSSEGSHQGCPAGSFLFCLGLAPKLNNIAQAVPRSFIGAIIIIDDITICTTAANLPNAIQIVTDQLREYNIDLAPHKSLIYSAPQSVHLIPNSIPSNIPISTHGFKQLGSPIFQAHELNQPLVPFGDNPFLANFLDSLSQKLRRLFQKICRVRNTQAAF